MLQSMSWPGRSCIIAIENFCEIVTEIIALKCFQDYFNLTKMHLNSGERLAGQCRLNYHLGKLRMSVNAICRFCEEIHIYSGENVQSLCKVEVELGETLINGFVIMI